jgi:hypothetical protein
LTWINVAGFATGERGAMTLERIRLINRAMLCVLVVLYVALAVWLLTPF